MKKNFPGFFLLLGALTGCGDSPSTDVDTPSQAVVPQIDVTSVASIIKARCSSCHSETPTDDVFKTAPGGVMLDNLEQMQLYAARILARSVVTQTMPFMNKTEMTEQERKLVGQWIKSGAPSN